MGCLKLALYIVVIFIESVILASSIQASELSLPANIIINLPSRTLEYYENNKLIRQYSVAIGKPSTPTPLGVFYIVDKEVNPCWYPPEKNGYVVASGPDNPLGFRWMGFTGNYGIHGTNAPLTIGAAVSNGCIRMYEEDVEELFERVQDNTPVHVIYDRVNIRINNKGQAFIAIYPDVYYRQYITLQQVKDKLISAGLGNLVEDHVITKLIKEKNGDKIFFATLSTIKINNKQLAEYLVWWNDILYVPAFALASHLNTTIKWDEEHKLIVGKQHTVSGIVKYDVLYVDSKDVPALFGVRQSFDEHNNCLLISVPELLLQGQPVTRKVKLINNRHYVPIVTVANALGKKLCWEVESNTFWLGSRKIAVTILEDEPYIEVAKVSEYFNIHVTCNEALQTLDMDYSCGAIDYSSNLTEMRTFVD